MADEGRGTAIEQWVVLHHNFSARILEESANYSFDDLAGIALRQNPRRTQLIVSKVLGKHVPATPRDIEAAGTRLGGLVADRLAGATALVVGFAETATLLGHLVADTIDATYLHSTRRPGSGQVWGSFAESHSHAPEHHLQPWPPSLMNEGEVLVLVDDELSTAKTVAAAIRVIHTIAPRARYVVAALVDLRSSSSTCPLKVVSQELSAVVEVVSLVRACVSVPQEVALPLSVRQEPPPRRGQVVRLTPPWPAGVREGARHGSNPRHPEFARVVAEVVPLVLAALPMPQGRTRVLGVEEFLATPFQIALSLPGEVRFSSTTRSPAIVVDDPAYPIRRAVSFAAHEAGSTGDRFLYNLVPHEQDQIVLVLDDEQDTPAVKDLVQALTGYADTVVVVTIPSYRPPLPLHGPNFGSYAAEDVEWLLTDLSHLHLEASTAQREAVMQKGGHYAESLPIEYVPDEAYLSLFHRLLAESATSVALITAVLGEKLRGIRPDGLVLVSLARAGTPLGVLLRRWAMTTYGQNWPHYAMSIVRGRGIDEAALEYLGRQHDPATVVFVDGWTGKGAIGRELKAAILRFNQHLTQPFADTFAVAADPGGCSDVFGTTADILLPWACLNSPVSGLVSRTVFNRNILRADQFHGAKFYRSLGDQDLSEHVLDTIADCFGNVHDEAVAYAGGWDQELNRLHAGSAPGQFDNCRGLAIARQVARDHRINDLNLVKPGVGETTRVLLRRRPAKILIEPAKESTLPHIIALAEARSVPVVGTPDLGFSCVGLIRAVDHATSS